MRTDKNSFLKINDLISPIQMQPKITGITITNARAPAHG